MVESTKPKVPSTLREILVHPGPAEQEFFSSLDGSKFRDKLFDIHTQKPALNNMKSRYVGSLIDAINIKFPVETMNILSRFTVLEPKKAIVVL